MWVTNFKASLEDHLELQVLLPPNFLVRIDLTKLKTDLTKH